MDNRIIGLGAYVTGGAKALLDLKIANIFVEDMGCAKSAAEGAVLGVFTFQDYKSKDKKTPTAVVNLAPGADGAHAWNTGYVLATSQNWART